MVDIHIIETGKGTCPCILRYSYDADLPLDQQEFFVVEFRNICPAHVNVPGVTNNQQLWDNVIRPENTKINDGFKVLIDNAPSAAYDVMQDGSRVFKKGISVSWAWTGGAAPNRILTINVSGISLTTNQKNSIQTKLDERFGISNVLIVNG